MGQPSYDYQQMIQCEECPVCKTDREGFFAYLREIKDQPLKDRSEHVLMTTNILMGGVNVVLAALLIGAIFHTYIIKYFKGKIPRIIIEKREK